jgi:SAM-dependent methyltransferase
MSSQSADTRSKNSFTPLLSIPSFWHAPDSGDSRQPQPELPGFIIRAVTGDSELAANWDAAYARGDAANSWYEPQPTMSLRMLAEAGCISSASVVDVGGGNSRLVDALLGRGHTDVTVLDLSTIALQTANARLGDHGPLVEWVQGDVRTWRPGRTFDAWHDRAVLHFLTTDADRAQYVQTLQSATEPGSIAVIATFAPDGPHQCSGLPVARYSASQIADLLGASWTLIGDARDEHETPSGATQPFTWSALRRV